MKSIRQWMQELRDKTRMRIANRAAPFLSHWLKSVQFLAAFFVPGKVSLKEEFSASESGKIVGERINRVLIAVIIILALLLGAVFFRVWEASTWSGLFESGKRLFTQIISSPWHLFFATLLLMLGAFSVGVRYAHRPSPNPRTDDSKKPGETSASSESKEDGTSESSGEGGDGCTQHEKTELSTPTDCKVTTIAANLLQNATDSSTSVSTNSASSSVTQPRRALELPKPEGTALGKFIRRVPFLVIGTAIASLFFAFAWAASHISGPLSSFIAAFIALGSLIVLIRFTWQWLTGLTWEDFTKTARRSVSEMLIDCVVPTQYQQKVRNEANTLLKWADEIHTAHSQLRLFRHLLNAAVIIGGSMLAYITIQKLTEQNHVAKTATLTTIIDQQFQEENEAARDAFDKISNILLKSVSEHEPSSIEEQVWAIGQIPNAMRMRVTRAVEIQEVDGTLSVERRTFLPNHAKLKTVFTQFIRMDRVGHTLKHGRNWSSENESNLETPKSVGDKSLLDGIQAVEGEGSSATIPNDEAKIVVLMKEPSTTDQQVAELRELASVSTEILRTLHMVGPGNQIGDHHLTFKNKEGKTQPLGVSSKAFTDKLRNLEEDLKVLFDLELGISIPNLNLIKSDTSRPLSLWNLHLPGGVMLVEATDRAADRDRSGTRMTDQQLRLVTGDEIELPKSPSGQQSASSVAGTEGTTSISLGTVSPERMARLNRDWLNEVMPEVETALKKMPEDERESDMGLTGPSVILMLNHLPVDLLERIQVPFANTRRGSEWKIVFPEKCDLFEAHLEGAHLKNAVLSGANLNSAHLEHAIFESAELRGADLPFAHLKGANLKHAQLVDSYLVEANFESVKSFGETNMSGAIMTGANLFYADLSRAKIEGCILNAADLREVFFGYTSLRSVDLSDANLEGAKIHSKSAWAANFSNAKLAGVDFSDSDLSGTEFYDQDMCGVDFSDATLDGCHFIECHLEGSIFQNAIMRTAGFNETHLGGANFNGAKLNGATFGTVYFEGADFERANLNGTEWQWADFSGSTRSEYKTWTIPRRGDQVLCFRKHVVSESWHRDTASNKVTIDVPGTRWSPRELVGSFKFYRLKVPQTGSLEAIFTSWVSSNATVLAQKPDWRDFAASVNDRIKDQVPLSRVLLIPRGLEGDYESFLKAVFGEHVDLELGTSFSMASCIFAPTSDSTAGAASIPLAVLDVLGGLTPPVLDDETIAAINHAMLRDSEMHIRQSWAKWSESNGFSGAITRALHQQSPSTDINEGKSKTKSDTR
jgi:uncharacterized protein YjbI with pentapeptide repeats